MARRAISRRTIPRCVTGARRSGARTASPRSSRTRLTTTPASAPSSWSRTSTATSCLILWCRTRRAFSCSSRCERKPNDARKTMVGLENPRTGAEILVRRLRDHGVRHIFGYPGGQITPIYDALYREPAIRHVLARAEQAAPFMADGYARVTARPGVAVAVCGPGVLNAATPL